MFPPAHAAQSRDGDAAIRTTDSDAALARLSAVKKGYLVDPYIRHLVARPHLQPARPPLINIGTFVRSEAIDELVLRWLQASRSHGTRCQIVSLGAGSDTRFWRLAAGPLNKAIASYIELDFPENTTKKAMGIKKSRDLSDALGGDQGIRLDQGGTALHSSIYHLIPVDLRLPPSETLSSLALDASPPQEEPILSNSLPTLLLFECVLVYMEPAASSALIQWFTDFFRAKSTPDGQTGGAPLGSIVYEMFGLSDAFGRVMLNNLKSRQVTLPGAAPYLTFASLPSRFTQHGFTTARALTLRQIRKDYVATSELERIAKLEMLDEVEELELVLDHYAITWGVKLPHPPTADGNAGGWESWGLVPASRGMAEEDND